MKCPLCETTEFYEGLTSRDCRNAKCELYARTEVDDILTIEWPEQECFYGSVFSTVQEYVKADLYRHRASIWFGVPEDQVTPEQRAYVKRLCFGLELGF